LLFTAFRPLRTSNSAKVVEKTAVGSMPIVCDDNVVLLSRGVTLAAELPATVWWLDLLFNSLIYRHS
jgi:hypothetical protein